MEWSDGGRGEVNTVITTGIYCRAGCSGRPHPSNTRRVGSSVAAEAAGFRPCLRCRPDHLPVAPILPGIDPFVEQALVLISDGFLDRSDESGLADAIGMSGRHLRRLFTHTIGATPSQVAASRRAHFARLLIDDTDLSMTDIAYASGFGSVRRMNEVVHSTFHFTPTELRGKRSRRDRSAVDGGIRLQLRPIRPVDLDQVIVTLGTWLVAGVESIAGGVYRRTTNVCGASGVIEIAPAAGGRLQIIAHLPATTGLIDEVARCKRLLRLDRSDDGPLGPWTHFEADVRSAAEMFGASATGLLAELAARVGTPVGGAAEFDLHHEFPTAPQIAQVRSLESDSTGAFVAAIAAIARAHLTEGVPR